MTQAEVNYLGEFAGRYADFKEVSGLAAKLGDRSKTGWSDARKKVFARAYADPRLAKAADLEADEATLDREVKTQVADANDIALTYFTQNLANIVEDIPDDALKSLAMIVDPVTLTKGRYVSVHNPAVGILNSYKGIEKLNKSYDKKEIQGIKYRDTVAKTLKPEIQTIRRIKGASESAKKAFADVAEELVLKSERFARVAGEILQEQKAIAFVRYFEEQTGNNAYTLGDFVGNNIAYGDPKKNMTVVGDVLLAAAAQNQR